MASLARGNSLATVLSDTLSAVLSGTRATPVRIEMYDEGLLEELREACSGNREERGLPPWVVEAGDGEKSWSPDEGSRISDASFCPRADVWREHAEGAGPPRWKEGDWFRFPFSNAAGRMAGCVAVEGTSDGLLLSKDDVERLELAASLASVAVSGAEQRRHYEALSEKLTQRTDLLEDLLTISSSIVSERSLSNLSDKILSSVATLFGFQRVSLIVFDESIGAFRWLALYGYPGEVTEYTLSRTIPTEMVLDELVPANRIARSAYHVKLENISETARRYMVMPDGADLEPSPAPRAKNELREGDTLAFPLHDAAGRIVGVIYPSMVRTPRILDEEMIETMGIFTSLAEVAMEDARLSAERENALRLSSQRAEQMSRIFDLTSELMYVRNLDRLLEDVLKTLSQLLGLKRMVIGLRDEERKVFVVKAVYGFPAEAAEKIKKTEYPIERVDYLIDPESRKDVDSPVKWRKKVGRRTYYMPAESVRQEESDTLYHLDQDLARRPRQSKDHWHELDYMDTFIMDRNGVVIAYVEILRPRDDRIPDPETIEVIEIFASLVGIAIENANLFESQIESRRAAEFYTDLLSHDIKNFNQAIMGYLDIMGSFMAKPEQRAQIDKIANQVMNVSRLANDVRTMSRLTWGEVCLARVDLGAVLLDCMNSVQMYHLSRKIDIRHSVEPEKVYVRADELLRELFVNILTNAVKYDQHEVAVIDVAVERVKDDGNFSIVSVADRGCGVPDDMKESIFERFSKAPKKKGSSGLGLHIVNMLAKRYGGSVWVEDRVPGNRSEGSVFKIRLPEC